MFRDKNILMIITLMVICLLHRDIYSQCDSKQNGYIFLHSGLQSNYWGSSDLQISLPQNFCSDPPDRVLMTGSTPVMDGVFAAKSGELSLSTVSYGKNSDCLCCLPELTVSEPIPTGLSIDTSSLFVISKYNNTLIIATSDSPLKVKIYSLDSTATVIHLDSVSFVQSNADQQIKTLYFESGKGIWVGGSGGLIRFIPYSNGTLNKTVSYDIDKTETIMVLDNDFAAGITGKLYKMSNSTFQFNQTLSISVQRGCKNWLYGNNYFAYFKNSRWETLEGVPDLVNAHLFMSDSGPLIEWIDRDWHYGSKKASNKPTRFKKIYPDSLTKYVNNGVFKYDRNSNKPFSFTIYLSDPDTIIQLPDLKPRYYYSSMSLYNVAGYTFAGMSQNPECKTGKAYLNSDTIKYTITRDSVYWESEFLLGTIDFTCGNCQQVRRHLRQGNYTRSYQEICLSTGADSLIFNAGGAVVTTIKNNESSVKISKNYILNNLLSISTGNQMSGGSLRIFSLSGKLLLTTVFDKNQRNITVPLNYTKQSVIIRIIFNNGFHKEQFIPGF